jgi:hypothetical protein
MIDGRLGRRELRVLERLYAHQYSTISPNQVVAWEKKYRDGYGMPELMQLVEKMGEK